MHFDGPPNVTGFGFHRFDFAEDLRRQVVNLSDHRSAGIVGRDDAAVGAEADELRALDVAIHDGCGATPEPDVVIVFAATERTVNEDAMEHRACQEGGVATGR